MQANTHEAQRQLHWQPVLIAEVVVKERQRELLQEHVERLRASFEQLGAQLQLQPIVIDEDFVLIDGAHRLAAAKLSGWRHISAVQIAVPSGTNRAFLECEANRVRLNLNPVELEAAWRKFYEPHYRAQARVRQLAGLRRGSAIAVDTVKHHTSFGASTTVAAAAKQVTGMSLRSLTKISEIREWASSQAEPPEVRASALEALGKLAHSRSSITAVHRDLRRLRMQLGLDDTGLEGGGDAKTRALEQVFQQSSSLSSRLEGDLGHELETLASSGGNDPQLLSAVRVALTRALATVVAIECRFEDDCLHALKRIGAEVSRLQIKVTTERLGLSNQGSLSEHV